MWTQMSDVVDAIKNGSGAKNNVNVKCPWLGE